ncbi:ribosomal-protein-alanine N-acetyltransferase [Scopulibacillus darangshiensis]|uniref:Ribosomal-protein-alanine N-acetyltransferase n=1 Tax=Scopulibacillus darangshiensis TaxID=442528 RepID=A0A4R2NZF4_9BACL|nr:GNAT family protein [Scopulibacillus darangshiensis]TCP27034.1 ribosomal-protein-alanine N-acetyltransferase [Scopulibacillus darangshiensis]
MSTGFPKITTDHLLLRQLKPDDAYDVYRLFSDKETMMFDGGQTMGSVNEAHSFIQAYASMNQPAVRWAVTGKESGALYGTAGFHHIDYQARKAEIGGELLKSYWGKGIAKEAFHGLISFGFQKMRLNRIEAHISPENRGAIATIQKAPFVKEGYLRECQRWAGQFVDLELYSLLYKDWASSTFYH